MSWSVYATGDPEKVKAVVNAAKCYGNDSTQLENIKPLVIAEIDRITEACPGALVKVECSGHYTFGQSKQEFMAPGVYFDNNNSRLQILVEKLQHVS